MLDESEWEQVLPELTIGIQEIKDYRRSHGVSLQEAKENVCGSGALERYFQITGFRAAKVETIWHHRLSLFGPPCEACGKPLRTPRARLCAECGTVVGAGS